MNDEQLGEHAYNRFRVLFDLPDSLSWEALGNKKEESAGVKAKWTTLAKELVELGEARATSTTGGGAR